MSRRKYIAETLQKYSEILEDFNNKLTSEEHQIACCESKLEALIKMGADEFKWKHLREKMINVERDREMALRELQAYMREAEKMLEQERTSDSFGDFLGALGDPKQDVDW